MDKVIVVEMHPLLRQRDSTRNLRAYGGQRFRFEIRSLASCEACRGMEPPEKLCCALCSEGVIEKLAVDHGAHAIRCVDCIMRLAVRIATLRELEPTGAGAEVVH